MSNFYVFRSSIAGASSRTTSSAARPEPLPCPSRTFHHRRSSSKPAATAAPPEPPAFQNSSHARLSRHGGVIMQANAQPIRMQQLADPLTELERPALYGTSASNYSSSGSNHDPSSLCLAAMVNEFLEEEVEAGHRVGTCGRARCNCLDGACSDEAGRFSNNAIEDADDSQDLEEHLCEILEGVTSCTGTTELLLLVDVAKAMEEEETELLAFAGINATSNESGVDELYTMSPFTRRPLRPVMKRLQQAGHNAAICKSRWNGGDGLPAGDYDYIDVIVEGLNGKQDRFIVDIDFKAQFEIARASDKYCALLNVLPRIFVGRGERLKQIVKIMSNAAKRSLKQEGLHLPPWRKQRYMQAKWFSSYKRTTNPQESKRNELTQYARIHDDDVFALAAGFSIGVRGPKVSIEFTKQMDMAFFRAQAKAMQQSRRLMQKRKEDLLLLNAKEGDEVPLSKLRDAHQAGRNSSISQVALVNTAGFLKCQGSQGNVAKQPHPFEQIPEAGAPRRREQVCTVVCTDWQLPALSEKSLQRGRVSGLATALKGATSACIDSDSSSRSAAPAG